MTTPIIDDNSAFAALDTLRNTNPRWWYQVSSGGGVDGEEEFFLAEINFGDIDEPDHLNHVGTGKTRVEAILSAIADIDLGNNLILRGESQ